MPRVFLIHGAYGDPKNNWFPWLEENLQNHKCTVFIPRFPTPENQNLRNWMKVFSEYENLLDSKSIVIGHSLGCPFLLKVLEKCTTIKAAFLVSGFTKLLGNPKYDSINKTFVENGFNWAAIRRNCKKFFVMHSDNDPYVPIENAKELANSLGVKVIIIKGAGHFNVNSGYTKFEELLEMVKKEI